MDLLEKLRLAQVKRYPICHTNRDQSVAEHSFGVMLIAQELAKFASDDKSLYVEVTEYAAVHDMEEIYTGDIPSGFKRRLRSEMPNVGALLDGRAPEVSPLAKVIVKLADYLEAIHYLKEYGGSRFSEKVLGDIANKFHAALKEAEMPAHLREFAFHLGAIV